MVAAAIERAEGAERFIHFRTSARGSSAGGEPSAGSTDEVVIADGGNGFGADGVVERAVGLPARDDGCGGGDIAVGDHVAAAEDKIGLPGVDGVGGHAQGVGGVPFGAGVDVGEKDNPKGLRRRGGGAGACGEEGGQARQEQGNGGGAAFHAGFLRAARRSAATAASSSARSRAETWR